MDEQVLKHITCTQNLKLRLNIFKDRFSGLQNLQINGKEKSDEKLRVSEKTSNSSKDEKIPQFMTLSKLEWDENEIHAGVMIPWH